MSLIEKIDAEIARLHEEQRTMRSGVDAERVWLKIDEAEKIKEFVLSEQKEPCKGCQHNEKYENELEYGYPSPCTQCKRRCSDNYLNQPYTE